MDGLRDSIETPCLPRQAVLLAAGKGERLGNMTRRYPKPMLSILGKPAILHNLEMCKRAGVREFYVNLHHCPETITEFLGDGGRWNVHITYSYEKTLLGTSGALREFRSLRGKAPFYVVYADNYYSNYDLRSVWERHTANDADMSIAVHQREDTGSSGVVVMDAAEWIHGFVEKPAVTIDSHWVNAGIYMMEPFLIDEIPEGSSDFGRDMIPRFLAEGRRVLAVKMTNKVVAIDTPQLFNTAADLRPS